LGEIYNKSNIKEKQFKSINLFLQIQNKSDELLFTISSIYYYKLKDATNALKYLDLIKINNDKSYFLRGYIYQFDNCNKELMKKNYLKAIELNHFIAMNNLGFSYFNKKKYDKALKYYKMSDEYCYSTATINIGDVYYTISNFALMKEYYLKFANYEKTTQADILYFVNKLKKTKTELLFLYDICIRFKIKDPFIEREGQLIKNKLKIINKFDICPICFDELPLIIYECFGHFYCVNCIYKINKCSLCLFVPTK
jgi:tetratricopeptide (TPR) repeat protein